MKFKKKIDAAIISLMCATILTAIDTILFGVVTFSSIRVNTNELWPRK